MPDCQTPPSLGCVRPSWSSVSHWPRVCPRSQMSEDVRSQMVPKECQTPSWSNASHWPRVRTIIRQVSSIFGVASFRVTHFQPKNSLGWGYILRMSTPRQDGYGHFTMKYVIRKFEGHGSETGPSFSILLLSTRAIRSSINALWGRCKMESKVTNFDK